MTLGKLQNNKGAIPIVNLTATQYQAQMDDALNKFEANSFTNLDRGAAWGQVASGYCHLWTHQALFDKKGITPSAAALVYRTQAETYLRNAKNRLALLPFSTPASVCWSNAAAVAAYAYVQEVKMENAV